MVLVRMCFTLVIAEVVDALLPMAVELVLAVAVSEPVEAHVHSFGLALFENTGKYAHCTFVVELQWGWSLWVAHFDGCLADW